jgi:hypothetical protein
MPPATMRVAICLLIASTQAGCVQRRLTIRSDPPGALVYVDNMEIGTTPCSTYFTYYGSRKIQLVKDGYETLTVQHRFWPPLYEIPPIDFVSENIVPFEIRDERLLNFKLVPQQLVPTDQLLERAENLRRGSRVPISPSPTAPAAPSAAPPPAQALPQPIDVNSPQPLAAPR